MRREALAILPLATLLAGCPVDLGWDVDQGDTADRTTRVTLWPLGLDVDHGDDADSKGVFALHSTSTFVVENPHDHWEAANAELAADPPGAATFSAIGPSDNVLTFDARFDAEGPARLVVRRRWGGFLDDRPVHVARATSASVLHRYAQTLLVPDATPDLGDALHVVEGGQVGVLIDWRDDQGRRLLGKRLLHLDVTDADEDVVKVVDRARDGATENTWGDWFNLVAVAPAEHAGRVAIAAGPDVVRTIDVTVHGLYEVDGLSLATTVGTFVDAYGAVQTTDWLAATALAGDVEVLAAPLQWYQDGRWVGEGTFASTSPSSAPRTVVVCAATTHREPGGPLDTAEPDTDPGDTEAGTIVDTLVDGDAADSDTGGDTDPVVFDGPVDSEPADTLVVDDGGVPVRLLRGRDGELCARATVDLVLREVRDERFDDPPKPKKCGACDTSAVAIPGGAVLLAVLGRRRRRR